MAKFLYVLIVFVLFTGGVYGQSLEVYQYRYDTLNNLQELVLTHTFDEGTDPFTALEETDFIPYWHKHLLPDDKWACVDTLDSLVFYRDCCNPIPQGVKKRVTSPSKCHEYGYYYANLSGQVTRYLGASAEVETEINFYYTQNTITRIVHSGMEEIDFEYNEKGDLCKVIKMTPLGKRALKFVWP